jgi:hypothetical protein
MKVNKWTMGLAALGLISLPPTGSAEEKMNQMWTALSSTTLSGYVNTSAHWNTGTGNGFTPAIAYNGSSKQDGFNLNALKVAIEKPLDEAQWAAGYKAELIYGPDATSYLTTLDSNPATGGDSSPASIKQAYVSLRAPVGNGLDLKMGVFDTIVGYEVFDGGNNPNYTRSYGFTIEPTTHTGLLASYQLCKSASLSVGIANTHGPAINEKADAGGLHAESYKTYMASVALTAPEDWGSLGGSTAYAGVVNGLNTAGPAVQTSWYVGMTMNTPVKSLKVGASFDYLGTSDRYGADDSYANAWALYTSFQATEKLSMHVRGEYASTDTGIFGDAAAPFTPGNNAEIVALTGTLQYDLWKNVLSRLEVRWDHLAGSSQQTGYGGTPAGGGGGGTTGSKRDNVLIAANVIYKF